MITAIASSNQKEKQKQLILSSNLWKVIFELSWPAVIAMILYGFNTFIDGVFVGRYVGETALAGVSVAYRLVWIRIFDRSWSWFSIKYCFRER
nr:MATE family efflux transporter [Tissierella sp. P1]